MNLVRTLISLLIVTIVVLSGFGIVWWNDPPEALAAQARGGQVILGLLMLLSTVGLVRLWLPAEPRTGAR